METLSLDPFNFLHSDLFDSIFQHFSSNEILTLSTVDPLWYENIGVSPLCMKKIRVNVVNSSYSTNKNDLEVMALIPELNTLVSIRQYRNIYADLKLQNKQKILQILSPKERQWRNVELINGNFSDGELFDHIQGTVEILSLTRIIFEEESSTTFLFPRLKNLEMSSCNCALIGYLKEASHLTSLHIQSRSDLTLSQKHLETLLINNKDLEEFTLLTHRPLLTNKITQCEFKLRKLVIASESELTTEDRDVLLSFINCQSHFLEVVDIDIWNSEVIEQCFRMERLKDLTCNVSTTEENSNLTCNLSLERVYLRGIANVTRSFLDEILRNSPNLKIYKADSINFEDLILLSARCKKLEQLYIEDFDVAVLPKVNCFPDLKIFRSWSVNDELMETLKTKGAKNSFEAFILNY